MKKEIFASLLFVSLLLGCENVEVVEVVDEPLEELKTEVVDTSIKANEGFILLNSIVSNNAQKIVYSEISECAESATNFSTYLTDKYFQGSNCDSWVYNVYTVDLASQKVRNIYSSEDQFSWIPVAKAGGCQNIYLPIAWSKDDGKIVLESAWPPSNCGADGGSEYLYYTLDSTGGELEPLAPSTALFFSDYSELIFTFSSEKSPSISCGPGSSNNNGKIVVKNIETGEERIVLEEENTYYELVGIDEMARTVDFKSAPHTQGCTVQDSNPYDSGAELEERELSL
ncbi:MAG: hypothetical protein WC777_04060 [Candidatus Gracilibacteria bacterium]|jgi:hypothetical protein